MPPLLVLTLAIAFAVLALARFATAIGDGRFLASSHMASKAAFGFAMTISLFALPLTAVAAEPFLVPLGIIGLSGLFLAPPTPRYSFLLAVAAYMVTLAAVGAHLFLGPPAGLLIALPVGLVVGHMPLPGRPSLRFLGGTAVAAGVALLLPSPVLLAPVAVLLLAVPTGGPYSVLDEEAPWDQRMLYYLGMGGMLLSTMVSLWVGAGQPLQDPAVQDAQLTVALIAAALLLIPVIKIGFRVVRELGVAEAD